MIRSPLPVSTREWIASESMAELWLVAAAMNLIAAIARLPSTAARTALLDFPSGFSGASASSVPAQQRRNSTPWAALGAQYKMTFPKWFGLIVARWRQVERQEGL